ncbi:MAG: hypothetical protein GX786_00915 [Clostridiales bacterium]|nr:hypothetical protein [Clostridiales bacterium]
MKRSLFHITSGRKLLSYNIVSVSGSDSDAIQEISVEITFDSHIGNRTYQYNVMMSKENEQWYIDPTSFKSSIEVSEENNLDTSNPSTEQGADQSGNVDTPAPEEKAATDSNTILYYNSDNGRYYHKDEECSSVNKKYLPLSGFYFDQLNESTFSKLTPCPECKPPARP